MKIKHFAGYGSVTATKVSKTKADGNTKMVIRVKGNHERGIDRNDLYDAVNWLLKKFDKSVDNWMDVKDFFINDYYITEGNLDVEVCDYTFVY